MGLTAVELTPEITLHSLKISKVDNIILKENFQIFS